MMLIFYFISAIGIIYLIISICRYVVNFLNFKEERRNDTEKTKPSTSYYQKSFMSAAEKNFYNILRELETKYKIVPQVNLASIISKNNYTFQNELFRNIDFAIFTYDYSKLLLLIELNDSTHNMAKRRKRDMKVQAILNDAGIPLMKFYTNKPNERNYVLNRILNKIEKDIGN